MIKTFNIILFLMYLYNVILTVFSLGYKSSKINTKEDTYKFLILIPCHNEEEVIYNTLLKTYESDYNKKKFLIIPILDNCTDNTKEQVDLFVKDSHCNNCIPIEVVGGSKPKAINRAVTSLKEKETWFKYDSIIVLDADNVVDVNLLSIFNNLMLDGYPILQSRILSQNDDNVVSKGFTSSFNFMTYGFQIARNKINLSATLCGTGFAIKRSIWDEINFTKCDTLTEDLEFSILSVLNGYKIKFVPETYVLNQNVEDFKASVVQRIRWCRGHMQVFMKYIRRLLTAYIKKPSFQLFDSIMFLITPAKSVVLFITGILLIASDHYITFAIPLVVYIYCLIFVYYVNGYKGKYFIPHILYSISMYFIVIIGAITYKRTKWIKTTHKKIDIKGEDNE